MLRPKAIATKSTGGYKSLRHVDDKPGAKKKVVRAPRKPKAAAATKPKAQPEAQPTTPPQRQLQLTFKPAPPAPTPRVNGSSSNQQKKVVVSTARKSTGGSKPLRHIDDVSDDWARFVEDDLVETAMEDIWNYPEHLTRRNQTARKSTGGRQVLQHIDDAPKKKERSLPDKAPERKPVQTQVEKRPQPTKAKQTGRKSTGGRQALRHIDDFPLMQVEFIGDDTHGFEENIAAVVDGSWSPMEEDLDEIKEAAKGRSTSREASGGDEPRQSSDGIVKKKTFAKKSTGGRKPVRHIDDTPKTAAPSALASTLSKKRPYDVADEDEDEDEDFFKSPRKH